MKSPLSDYDILQRNLIHSIDQKPDDTPNTLGLRWDNLAAVARVNQLYRALGRPKSLDKEVGGHAKWVNVDPFFRHSNSVTGGKNTEIYSKLVVKDEKVPHLVPAPHNDWFYAYMYMDIPDHKLHDVLALTESVSYDTMKREICARCHFMPANLVTLYLSKQIVNGHKNLAHAQQEYVVLIPILAKESMEGGDLMMQENAGNWHKTLTQYTFSL